MQLSGRAVHLALQGGIDGALLLHAVQAAKALVDNFGGIVISVTGQIGDGDLCLGKETRRRASISCASMAMGGSLSLSQQM